MNDISLFWRSDITADATLFFVPDAVFGQRFRLLNKIGEGGFGQVWRAIDLWLNQEVALKISREDMSNETLLLRRLPKDRYVSIFDYVKDCSVDASAYAMELLDSPWMTLELYRDKHLAEKFTQGKYVLGVKETLCIIIDILQSLEVLHGRKYKRSQRWCHADIKPQNIYIDKNHARDVVKQNWENKKTPFTKIGDLGLAIEAGEYLNGGTMKYMAPEQNGARPVSAATDIFAIGQTIAFLILGKPLDSQTLAHENRIRNVFRASIPSIYVADGLTHAIRNMTLRTPTLRPSSQEGINQLKNIVKSDNDWQVLLTFESSELTLSEAGEHLFYKMAKARSWRNINNARIEEMKSLVRSAYKREILVRNGHRYRVNI